MDGMPAQMPKQFYETWPEDIGKKVSELSGGQKKRVALAQVLIESADLLILDEPTNHLDFQTVKWLEEYLSKYSGAILLVTHDRYFLDRVTNRIFELDGGNLYSYKGNYAAFLEAKAIRKKTKQHRSKKAKTFTGANWNGLGAAHRPDQPSRKHGFSVLKSLMMRWLLKDQPERLIFH